MNPSRALTTLVSIMIASLAFAAPALALDGKPQPCTINVQADQVLGPVSRYLTGACIEDVNHEIYGGLYSQMLFGESFQEPPLTPAIKGFKAFGGAWSVRDGSVRIAGLDGPKLISDHPPFRDGVVGVKVLFADRQGENAGLIVRASQPGVGADKFTGYEVALNPANQTVRLGRHRNNFELIMDAPCPVAAGAWVALEVKLAGPVIEVRVEGKAVLRHDDGEKVLPAGGVGLRAWHCTAGFRNLWVNTAGQVEPLAFEPTARPMEISGLWRAVRRGSATGRFALVSERPFAGTQSQQLSFDSGDGEWGLENQGLNRWGLSFVAGRPYEGYVWACSERPVRLFLSLESRDGAQVYAETSLVVRSNDWQRLDFTLTPRDADVAGRFALKLKQPGTVTLGHAFLQPGSWGRFKGLPVRRDVAEALVAQGLTVLRYGGSMVNAAEYRWKKMLGPSDRRPPYAGAWYRYASNGWGILDFMEFCEAAGFEYIPAFYLGEPPQDMADFIEYAKGPADTPWGRRRAADGHRQPYRLHYLELGNEERVDENYFAKFKPLAEAIWANDPEVTLVVGDFFYNKPIADPFHFDGGAVNTLAAHQKILDLAQAHGREVWFDVHIGTEAPPQPGDLAGPRSFYDQLGALRPGARARVAIFEFNAGNHAHRRALANALAILRLERDGRFPVATSANCLQPDGQNDNGWDQGLLFLNPSQVWLQPPGYVTQMISRNYQPQLVKCDVSPVAQASSPSLLLPVPPEPWRRRMEERAGERRPLLSSAAQGSSRERDTTTSSPLEVAATRSADGRALVLQVVNPTGHAVEAEIQTQGFRPHRPQAQVTELAGPLDAVNTAEKTDAIVPKESAWRHGMKAGAASRSFPPHSFTVIRFE